MVETREQLVCRVYNKTKREYKYKILQAWVYAWHRVLEKLCTQKLTFFSKIELSQKKKKTIKFRDV